MRAPAFPEKKRAIDRPRPTIMQESEFVGRGRTAKLAEVLRVHESAMCGDVPSDWRLAGYQPDRVGKASVVHFRPLAGEMEQIHAEFD